MRGYITKRAKDSYTIVLNLGNDPTTGKRKQQWISIKGTKKEAEKKLSELLNQIDTGSFVKPGKLTLGDYLERWLKDYAKPNLAPRTYEGYDTVTKRHLIPRLGKLPLTQLKPEHIQKYYADMLINGRYDGKGGLNPLTVTKHHLVLHCALEQAIKWALINRNPADAVSPPATQQKEIHAMNENEVHIFLEAAKGTVYYELFYTALYTGMRRSELLAIRWSDVDLLLCQISVNRSLHQLHDRSIIIRQPKTAKGRRMIALSPSLSLLLKQLKEKQMIQKMMLGTILKEDDLIFSQEDGSPLLPDTVSHAWVKLARKTGLKGIRLHDARHSHASLLLKNGVHPKVVQERLGHASIQITLDTYSHVVPGLQEAAAKSFDKLLENNCQTDSEKSDIENVR